jgi:hypothetical protein
MGALGAEDDSEFDALHRRGSEQRGNAGQRCQVVHVILSKGTLTRRSMCCALKEEITVVAVLLHHSVRVEISYASAVGGRGARRAQLIPATPTELHGSGADIHEAGKGASAAAIVSSGDVVVHHHRSTVLTARLFFFCSQSVRFRRGNCPARWQWCRR